MNAQKPSICCISSQHWRNGTAIHSTHHPLIPSLLVGDAGHLTAERNSDYQCLVMQRYLL